MDKVLKNEVVEEILSVRLPITKEYQKCSFILPDGKFIKLFEHYEAYRFLVIQGLVACVPDAEQAGRGGERRRGQAGHHRGGSGAGRLPPAGAVPGGAAG